MAKKNKTKRINMSKVKKFYQPKAGEANMNLEKLGLSVCDVWYSKKECQEAFPNEKIKKLKRKEVDFSPSFVDAPAGYKDIRKGKKKMSNKFKKLKALKAKDEVIYTYGSTSAIAKVVSTDRKIIQVEHMNGKLQEFDVEGDSITGLCSMIRAVDKRELLAIKLSLLWDDDWEVLDEDDLARILYKVVNGRKITPSKSYAGIKERCGVDIDYDEVPHEEYVKNGGEVCPFCKSDESIEATGKFSSVMGINTYLDIECGECGKKWEETYTLSGYKEKA